jgi:SET domain-containing protein
MRYINHKPDDESNVVFRYIEGPTRRKVIVIAREDIEEDEELFVDYGDAWYVVPQIYQAAC